MLKISIRKFKWFGLSNLRVIYSDIISIINRIDSERAKCEWIFVYCEIKSFINGHKVILICMVLMCIRLNKFKETWVFTKKQNFFSMFSVQNHISTNFIPANLFLIISLYPTHPYERNALKWNRNIMRKYRLIAHFLYKYNRNTPQNYW